MPQVAPSLGGSSAAWGLGFEVRVLGFVVEFRFQMSGGFSLFWFGVCSVGR